MHGELVSPGTIFGVVGIEKVCVMVCVIGRVVISVSQTPSIADVEYASLLLAPMSVNMQDKRDPTNSGILPALKSELDLNGTHFFVI